MSLCIGGVYQHPDGPIYITEGQYLSQGRVSNFWYWKRIKDSGALGKKEYCGYGGDWPKLDATVDIIVNIKEVF